MSLGVPSFLTMAPPSHVLVRRQGIVMSPEERESLEFGQCVASCEYQTSNKPTNASMQSSIIDQMGEAWSPSIVCYDREEGSAGRPYLDCRKEGCEDIASGKFHDEMVKCFEETCKGFDDDFEYHRELVKSWVKFNQMTIDQCEEVNVTIEKVENKPLSKEDFEKGERNDTNDEDDDSGAGVNRPWKGGLAIGALLVGSFFAVL
ncbi:hypothetical protein BJ508DRAFT_375971 [Ascobolus immersus RN42]|uniref:Uncharacterized protein n=1 Tax=Ascobolus immersus RN42 TaxID=1160509 RepID=A0A3N4I7L8_ASCIM|nr:hypothetical protein BJ508DRAFT_375971 [Ascobolus immersus RN42]